MDLRSLRAWLVVLVGVALAAVACGDQAPVNEGKQAAAATQDRLCEYRHLMPT